MTRLFDVKWVGCEKRTTTAVVEVACGRLMEVQYVQGVRPPKLWAKVLWKARRVRYTAWGAIAQFSEEQCFVEKLCRHWNSRQPERAQQPVRITQMCSTQRLGLPFQLNSRHLQHRISVICLASCRCSHVGLDIAAAPRILKRLLWCTYQKPWCCGPSLAGLDDTCERVCLRCMEALQQATCILYSSGVHGPARPSSTLVSLWSARTGRKSTWAVCV